MKFTELREKKAAASRRNQFVCVQLSFTQFYMENAVSQANKKRVIFSIGAVVYFQLISKFECRSAPRPCHSEPARTERRRWVSFMLR